MGTQFLNVAVGRCSAQPHKTDSTMFRFIALFALVAVAFAEPEAEADPQYFYHHMGVPVVKPVVPVVKAAVPVVKPVVPVVRSSHPQFLQHHMAVPVVKPVAPVVKYVDPHHTEGMTKDGVPEKTDSVKMAEKQHEIAQMYEKAKKTVVPYVGYPYAYTYPYAQSYVPTVGHVVAKREAEGEADPYLFYNNHLSYTGYPGYPYTTAASFPYNTAVAGYPYTTTMTGYHYPYTHTIAKREAEWGCSILLQGVHTRHIPRIQ